MAVLHHIFVDIASNTGLDFSTLLCIIVFLVGFIAYALGVERGTMIQMVLMALVFMFDIVFNLDYTIPLVLIGVSLIILSFSLWNGRDNPTGLM